MWTGEGGEGLEELFFFSLYVAALAYWAFVAFLGYLIFRVARTVYPDAQRHGIGGITTFWMVLVAVYGTLTLVAWRLSS